LFTFERISTSETIEQNDTMDDVVKKFYTLQKDSPKNTKILGKFNAGQKVGYVLTNLKGEKLSGDWLSKMVKKYFRKAGLKETYSLHTLRHTFACNLLIKDYPIYTVSKLLNHKSVKTTEDFYTHVSSDYMKVDTNFYSN